MGKYYDYNYLNDIPVRDVLEQIGVDVNSRGKCFCVNPNCPDNGSKKRGASVNDKKNTIHCFVCGETYGNIGIIQASMGFSFDKEGYRNAAEYMAETLGYSEAIHHTVDKYNSNQLKQDNSIMTPIEKAIKNIQKSFTPQYLKEIGLEQNPFTTNYVHIDVPRYDESLLDSDLISEPYEEERKNYTISLKNTVNMVSDKIKETINNYAEDYNKNLQMFRLLKNEPDKYLLYKLAQCKNQEIFKQIDEIVSNPECITEKEQLLNSCKQDIALNIKSDKEKIKSHTYIYNQAQELIKLVEKIEKYEPNIYNKLSKEVDTYENDELDEETELEI